MSGRTLWRGVGGDVAAPRRLTRSDLLGQHVPHPDRGPTLSATELELVVFQVVGIEQQQLLLQLLYGPTVVAVAAEVFLWLELLATMGFVNRMQPWP